MKIELSLVRQLISDQFPGWSNLEIRPVEVNGWDNSSFRLGDEMSIRLPTAERYVSQVQKEQEWLPRLSPFLPCLIPKPLAMGSAGSGYPWSWSVYRWIKGESVSSAGERRIDLTQLARNLAKFLRALHEFDSRAGPAPGEHNFFRGGSLAVYDAETKWALGELKTVIDTDSAIALWESALSKSWEKPPLWIHGDLSPGNILVEEGVLRAVIDFGGCGVGDPACDLAPAWTIFSGQSREAFFSALDLASDTWNRARAWVLWKALKTLVDDIASKRDEARHSRSLIEDLLASELPS